VEKNYQCPKEQDLPLRAELSTTEKRALILNHLPQTLSPKRTKVERNLSVQDPKAGKVKEELQLVKDGTVANILVIVSILASFS
jgi:hypothetical protein